MDTVKQAQSKAREAEKAQFAAWKRWQETDSAEDQSAWEAAVDAQNRAEDAVDRAEVMADRMEAMDEDRQSDWWVAAVARA